jgi:hypothetical protein
MGFLLPILPKQFNIGLWIDIISPSIFSSYGGVSPQLEKQHIFFLDLVPRIDTSSIL